MLTPRLLEELSQGMTLKRLYHAGLFVRLPVVHEELTAEIKLHRAVLDQAILDQFSRTDGVKRDVERWLDLNGEDFKEACHRADLEPRLVFEVFIQIKKILKSETEVPTNFQ